MTAADNSATQSKNLQDILGLSIRGLVALNAALVAVSWMPWFEGTADKPGAADRLLGNYLMGGFRIDGVWLFFTTGIVLLAFLYFASIARRNRSALINAFICLIGIVAFLLFVYRIITTGVLDFG